ncbi:MAG: alpha/beta hydrolase [Muribaculaceae bacterium]|nr:alpha/beta hydrolase [Muribaculaceae bacterium]
MPRIIAILFFILISLMAINAQKYEEINDISYTPSGDPYALERCKLDIYYSPDLRQRPVVVWFHGGGLTGGEKFIPEELKESGYVVVAPNYRLIPKVEVDSCLDDSAAAVAWVFNNIEDYGGDPSKIFVAGHSAGGYLTSLIGLDKKWLEKYDIDADSIRGLIPYSGQAITHYAHRQNHGISELQPTIDEYAPLFHIRKDAPPYVIISGDREMELFGRYEENAYLWRMLKLIGHPYVEIYEIGGYDHGAMAAPAHHILKSHIKRILQD